MYQDEELGWFGSGWWLLENATVNLWVPLAMELGSDVETESVTKELTECKCNPLRVNRALEPLQDLSYVPQE